jgi:Carboxypeptidase regulatory-like domain/TonB dependent receptor-like, beta-barrel/TonB-dependent Receptor Plug Domain
MEGVMTMHSRGRLVGLACASLLFAGLGATSARAQAILEGKLTGTILDSGGAVLPGATVEVSGPALLAGGRSTTTSSRGTYVFLNLPLGRYTVSASMSGFKTTVRQNITVSPDAATTLDIALEVGAVEETVTVTAEGPIVDTKSSTIDSKIDREMLARLPTSRDAFYDLVLTTPGMFDSSSTNTLPSPTAYGSATNENVFLINGVNATNPEAGSFGTLVNVNYDAVEEVRVVALGSKAEYGSFSGAAIDVLTKSGSNAVHGSAAFYSILGDSANNQPGPGDYTGSDFLYVGEGEQLSGTVKKDWEASGTLGGPIVKDKLWFFGAFDYLKNGSLPPRWSLETTHRGTYADAKLTAAPFTNHRASISYHYETNDDTGASWGSEPQWETVMSYNNKSDNNTVSAQWQWFPNGTTTASAKFLGFWKADKPYLPAGAPDHPGYVNWWKLGEWGMNGAFPYVDAQKANRKTIQADLSHYAEGFLGRHDIKFGVQYTKGRGDRQGGYFQNYTNYLYPLASSQDVAYLKDYYDMADGLLFYNYKDTINPFLTVRTTDSVGLFFDDQWSIGKRLTLNVGLRFDHMTSKYGVGKVYDFPSSPAQINDPPPVLRDRMATDNIFDFKTFAPRIGLSYMLTEDGKTVARAAYGRYYMPLSLESLRRLGPDLPPLQQIYQLYQVPWDIADPNGDGFLDISEIRNAAKAVYGRTPLEEEATTIDHSWSLNVADNLKDQYTDQITLNLERQIAKDFAVSASYIYKHATNLFANVPINRQTGQEWEYDRIPFTTSSGQQVMLYSIAKKDYNGDGVFNSDDVAWIVENNTSLVENMPAYDGVKPKRDYQGLQLVLRKRYSDRWQALASFLYSHGDGMGRRPLRQDINVDAPEFWDDNWMGSLNYTINNLDGQLPFTPKYEFKLSGSYRVPNLEVDLGARLRVSSGKPMWLTEAYPQLTQWGGPDDGVIDPGGLGRIVAVTEPSYLPTQALLDLHLERAFKFSNSKAVRLVVDGFNVFNSNTPTDIDIQYEWGKVTAIPTSRLFRFGARFEF